MVLVADIHAEAPELADKLLDLLFDGVAAHVAEVLVGFASKYLEDGSRESVCNSDFGLIART
ncbi:MAG: hypothetical protein HC883_01510 [Bdellovibrionaceae bacterium]|nr:hypothetical protein [Pseudobdellovibrionaceae bacterium]